MAYIYLITNTINNKVYVGKTELSIEKRFQEHIHDSKKERCKNRPLYRAMNKYGTDNFTVKLLEITDKPEEREVYWIAYYNSYHYGYNATRGGDGKKYIDYELVCNTYQKLRNAKETAEFLGVSTDSVYAVMKQRGGLLSSSIVNKEKQSKSVNMYNADSVFEQTFLSLKDAARYLINMGVAHGDVRGVAASIRKAINDKRPLAYGKQWQWKT